MPSQLDDESPGLLLRILQLRAYVDTWQAIKHAESQKDAPKGPMTEVWSDVQAARREAELAEWLGRQREEG